METPLSFPISKVIGLTAALASAGASPVLIVHADGSRAPYTTIAAALAASVSGDLICVYQSATFNGNMAKNGVNWWVAPGVTITNNSNSAGYMFDDLGSACSYNVNGDGSFVRVITGAAGAGTIVNVLCGVFTTDVASKDLVQGSSAVINANAGSYNANKTTGTITGIGQINGPDRKNHHRI